MQDFVSIEDGIKVFVKDFVNFDSDQGASSEEKEKYEKLLIVFTLRGAGVKNQYS